MKPGEQSESFASMEVTRRIPRLLDSRRRDGGVSRLLTNPGGKIEPGGELPLLVQHAMEHPLDYLERAATAAPRDLAWLAVASNAGKPFEEGVGTFGSGLPNELEAGGPWRTRIDGMSSLETFCANHAVDLYGYGLAGWVWVTHSSTLDRPIWRWIDASSVPVYEYRDGGQLAELHINWTFDEAAAVEYGVPEGEGVLRFLAAGPGRKVAEMEIYVQRKGKYLAVPDVTVPLPPHQEIPVVPWWVGQWDGSFEGAGGSYLAPPYLSAFKLDHLLLQVTSNTEFAAVMALTFLRFAKGLTEVELKKFEDLGNQFFYGATKAEADMKWVVLPAEGVQGGLSLIEALTRALEVAGVAPMLQRMPGNELATGQAMAGARARSQGEVHILQLESVIGQTLRVTAIASGVLKPEITVRLAHPATVDVGHLELLSRLFMAGEISRLAFFTHIQKAGILPESAPLEDLVATPEEAAQRIERMAAVTDYARALMELRDSGGFRGTEGTHLFYGQLQARGFFTDGFSVDAAVAAHRDEDDVE